ncbi:hypothetical protein LDO26_02845 [Luteimonas sp. BDR2-5]|uniref:hypothetical protein n=1 Tax=Proluteimonas luteida TaxID=2878685 RepID=UPI001E33B118|nr:hypothetical protein [Luteimonas sp. BDR2-5]MCD9027152.1 hypothetical protein [Luteimonas sp. BDR2-5]
MISGRVLWRTLMLPAYTLAAGVVFSAAFARTDDSMLAFLAGFAAWPMIVAGVVAAVMLVAGLVRIARLRARRLRDASCIDAQGASADVG